MPVTLKMRLGWDHSNLNAPELARRAENSGVRMVTVHGRTRCQFYRDTADWAAIRAVKDTVSIPVIANGDLTAFDDLDRMLAQSGADGVMIGRGACGRPWLPGHIARFAASGVIDCTPTGSALAELVLGHYDALCRLYGPLLGVRNARKHIAWYMDHAAPQFSGDKVMRQAILTESDPRKVVRSLRVWFAGSQTRRAA